MQAVGKGGVEGDRFIRYPVMLEQWLMEGAYDRVWGAMKGEGVPSEEFAVFSEVRTTTFTSIPYYNTPRFVVRLLLLRPACPIHNLGGTQRYVD